MNLHLWSPGFIGFGGGITAFSRDLALALHALAQEVRLIGKHDTPGAWHGFPLWGAANLPRRLQTPAFLIGALSSCARYRPDHLISTHLNFGPAAHWAKRAFGTRYTLVAHGIDVHDGLSPARRAALRAADRVVAVSSWTHQRILHLGDIDPARVVVLPNMVDEARFAVAPRPETLARRYNLQPGERVILAVGRLDTDERYKGYDRVVQALPILHAACGRVRFLLAGTGSDRDRVQLLAQELGVEGAVTFTGFVPDHELADHYRLADVFAMPSTGEGFGIVFLEAMACGTPVLAGDRDGAVDALDDGRLGRLVDPTDVHAIASGIIALLKQEGPRWWFDRRALHEAVIERFGRAAFSERLRTFLSSLPA